MTTAPKVPVDQVENLQVVRQVVKPVVEYVEKTVPKVRNPVETRAISKDFTENEWKWCVQNMILFSI